MHKNIRLFTCWVLILCALAATSQFFIRLHTTVPHLPIEEPTAIDSTRRMTLLFAGDWMQHKPQVTAARRDTTFDYTPSTRDVAPLMREADFTIVNLETTLTRKKHYTGYPLFRSPVALTEALQGCGVDVALLANNHCCDGGKTGLKTTIEELGKRHILHTGAFIDSLDHAQNRILYLEHDSLCIALVNYTYGTNGMPIPKGSVVHLLDTVQMARDLQSIDRQKVDGVVACLHWGNEYERRANSTQRALADFLKRHGVEVIIGSHPHVVQPIERDSLSLVVWSLGNFVSNQQKRYTDGGLMVKVGIERCGEEPCRLQTEVIPVWVMQPNYRILPYKVADTLEMRESQRLRYDQFMADTRSLIPDFDL